MRKIDNTGKYRGKEVLMNGIGGVSFREGGLSTKSNLIGRPTGQVCSSGLSLPVTAKGLEVHVKRSSNRASPGKIKKRLPYSFKQLSREIREVKTSVSARPLVTRIQAKLSWLYKKLRSGEYGDSEITAAILHAAAMEKIAKRKVRHLEEEEAAENGNTALNAPGEEEEIYGKDELEKSLEENEDISDEKMRQMMEEIKELEEELAEDMMSELQDMISCSGKKMSEEEIKELKRDHRNKEDRQLTIADLKYLKALFDRLEQEKRQTSSGIAQSIDNDSGSTLSFSVDCLPEVEMADMDIGETVDVGA